MVAMQVFGLALDEDSQVPILILKSDEDAIFPIWIGAMEAMAISLALNNLTPPRPMTHDLLLSVVEKLGCSLVAVEIVSVVEGTYYAELVLARGEERMRIDCRPSDGVALALRAKAGIFVAPEVLAAGAARTNQDFQEVLTDESSEKWTEILAKYSLDDIKYKM
jgi:hypothetical protein